MSAGNYLETDLNNDVASAPKITRISGYYLFILCHTDNVILTLIYVHKLALIFILTKLLWYA